MKKTTVIDVAKKAGVSQSTVSRVLNQQPQIKESTRKRVLKAIEELNYSPNEVARSMVMKKTKTLGLIVADISNPFFAETAKVIIKKARKINYDILITETDYNNDNFEENVKTMVNKRVDGILISTVHHEDSIINELAESGFPIVYFNRKPYKEDIHYVAVKNKKGISLAVKHLAEQGHKDIAFLSHPKYLAIEERYTGYLDAMRQYGLEINNSLINKTVLSYEDIFEFVSSILSTEAERPTGFITTSAQQALSVMDSVSRLGLGVPGDISVVGFGDIEIASHPYIGLTTVSTQKRQMAEIALEELIKLIDEESDSQSGMRVLIEPELIIRKTTGFRKGSFHGRE